MKKILRNKLKNKVKQEHQLDPEAFKRRLKEALDEIYSIFDEEQEGENENGEPEIDGDSENLLRIGAMA